MTNGPMKYRKIFAELFGTAIQSDIAEMNVLPLDMAINLSTFFCEVTGHVRMQHLKREDDRGFDQRKNLKWIERQIGNKVQNVFIDGRKEYLSEAESLELEEIKMCTSACYTTQENGRAERMNRALKKSIRSILIYSTALANYWAKYSYAALDGRNCLVQSGGTKNSEQE